MVDDSNIDSAASELRAAFAEGKPAIILVGKGVNPQGKSYTGGGHYMVAIGENASGNLIIINCGRTEPEGFEDTGLTMEEFFKYHMGSGNGNCAGRGFMVPVEAPSGFYPNEAKIFEGYEKYQPIVSPATAKILEIGTVKVTNENTSEILDRFYVAEKTEEQLKEESGNNNNNTEEKDSDKDKKSKKEDTPKDNKKLTVTQEQYDNIKAEAQSQEDDEENPFGKTYTTGYIKLEVIGSNSMEKFSKMKNSEILNEKTYDGLDAFYQDYYNANNNKSICDSYIIYIEGIDLTGSLEATEAYESLDDLIIGRIFNENSNDENTSLANSIGEKGIMITNDNTVKKEFTSSSSSKPSTSTGSETSENSEKDYSNNRATPIEDTDKSGDESKTASETKEDSIVLNDPNGVKKSKKTEGQGSKIKIKLPEEDSENDADTENEGEDDEGTEYNVNYYTRREIPKYYVKSAKKKMRDKEDKKDKLASIIKIDNELYIKAGTLIGLTGDSNMKIIMKDKEEAVVENVEDYLEIEKEGTQKSKRQVVDQEYEAQPNDEYRLAALMHHEYCPDSSFIANSKVRDEHGNWVYAKDRTDEQGGGLTDIARVAAYICINNALKQNKTIEEFINTNHNAYGSCSDAYNNANANSGNWCPTCLENAEWCLTYDCTSVVSSEGIPMTKNCITQSSFDIHCYSAWSNPNTLERWWLVDADGDGYVRDDCWFTGGGAMDGFYLRESSQNEEYDAEPVKEYPSSVLKTHE